MTTDWKVWVAEAALRYNAVVILVTSPSGIQALLMPRRSPLQ